MNVEVQEKLLTDGIRVLCVVPMWKRTYPLWLICLFAVCSLLHTPVPHSWVDQGQLAQRLVLQSVLQTHSALHGLLFVTI